MEMQCTWGSACDSPNPSGPIAAVRSLVGTSSPVEDSVAGGPKEPAVSSQAWGTARTFLPKQLPHSAMNKGDLGLGVPLKVSNLC